MKASIHFAHFPYGARQHPDVQDWLHVTITAARADPRVGEVTDKPYDDTPITMTRNQAVEDAKALKADVLVMVDNDMKIDAYLPSNPRRLGVDHTAKPFWESSFDWLMKHRDVPAMVCVPYCGPPPHENVYVFRWAKSQSGHPNADMRLEWFAREEAATFKGIFEVAALPTGAIIIDMRVFDLLKPPYFDYEWTDATRSAKASTEDVFFTRNASLAGARVLCNWDAWAGHWKAKCVGKPCLLTPDSVRGEFREALERRPRGERLVVMGEGRMERPHTNGQPAEPVRNNPLSDSMKARMMPALGAVTQSSPTIPTFHESVEAYLNGVAPLGGIVRGTSWVGKTVGEMDPKELQEAILACDLNGRVMGQAFKENDEVARALSARTMPEMSAEEEAAARAFYGSPVTRQPSE